MFSNIYYTLIKKFIRTYIFIFTSGPTKPSHGTGTAKRLDVSHSHGTPKLTNKGYIPNSKLGTTPAKPDHHQDSTPK